MKKRTIILFSLLITITFLFPYSIIRRGITQRDITENKDIAWERIHGNSRKMVEKINQVFEHIEAIEIIMDTNPDNLEIIQEYSKMVSKKHDTIANIAIAPNGIVENIYPLEGNEAAIGHNLMEDPERDYFIKKAIQEKSTIIQGPVDAIQGGVLVFSRKPIFIEKDNIEEFWGLVVIAMDFEELMKYAGLNMDDKDYLFRVNALKSNSIEDYTWGNLEGERDSISNSINFENQVWELELYPKKGWEDKSSIIFGLRDIDILYIILSLLLFIFIYRHLNEYQQQSIEVRLDTMTGTLNRNTFLASINKNLNNEKNKIQGFIIMDINDFKHINDTYGHMIGDFVIIEFAKRLLENHRDRDFVSRWGGDEFTIYLNDLKDESHMIKIRDRIEKSIEEPFVMENICLDVRAAIGYALYPNDGLKFEDLYKKADMMMYDNKAKKC